MKSAFINKLIPLLLSAAMALCVVPSSVYADTAISDTEILEDDDTPVEETTAQTQDELAPDEDADGATDSDELVPDEESAVAGGGIEEKVVTLPARRIKVTSGTEHKMKPGAKMQITYRLRPVKSDDYIMYKSYNRSVIQVSDTGEVTAVGYGSSRVRLKTSSGAKIYVYITVTDENEGSNAKADAVSFAAENVMLRKGKTSQLETVFTPYGSSGTLSYASSDTSVATVSAKGVVTGINDGSTTITATLANGKSAACTVTVYSGVYKGIDVSKWQGNINWSKVSNAGVDFAMIRSSFGSENVDGQFEANVRGCEKYNIPYGFYHYTYASSVNEAVAEAHFFLDTIRPYSPKYPIVLDIENELYNKMSRKKVTDIIDAFMTELENAGYYAMVYSYANFFNDHVDMDRMDPYDIWIASWGDADRLSSVYTYHYGMWQYSAKGSVAGITGEVDLDYSFKDYEKRIKQAGLNNL